MPGLTYQGVYQKSSIILPYVSYLSNSSSNMLLWAFSDSDFFFFGFSLKLKCSNNFVFRKQFAWDNDQNLQVTAFIKRATRILAQKGSCHAILEILGNVAMFHFIAVCRQPRAFSAMYCHLGNITNLYCSTNL